MSNGNSHSALRYTVRQNSDSAFQHKVFCAFASDDHAHFDRIAKDILSLFDCALFYYPERVTPPELDTLEADLDAMSAIVLIVTSRFLFGNDPFFQNVVHYAKERGIPILPILMEEGLENAINEALGNLQCLSPFFEKSDATVLPFCEKLKKYFSSVFATEVSKEQLKSGFSASIFLSYRKKDRKVAKKLIDLIHASPECRRIAIWYDEFLIPGEDFNEGISAELCDSTLFVLAVTPFTADGNNYIKMTEYPMASALNKPILPFEMEETDRGVIREAFPDMPAPVTPDSADTVRKVLENALEALDIQPVEATRERSFYMGLAYLMGVCVEKNYTYARELIGQAAEEKLPEAIERLALMYKTGEAVGQDLTRATALFDELLALKEADKNADRDTVKDYFRIAFELAETASQNGDVTKATDTYQKIVALCEGREDLAAYAANAYELGGKLLMTVGAYRDATRDYFEKALALRQALCREAPSAASVLNLIDTHIFIAICHRECDQVVGVKEKVVIIKNLLEEARSVIAIDPNTTVHLKRMIAARNALTGFLIYMIPLNVAGSWDLWEMTQRSVNASRLLVMELLELSATPDAKKEEIHAYLNEGDLHATSKVENHLRAALDCYAKAENALTAYLEGREDSYEAFCERASLYVRRAYVYRLLKRNEEALAEYTEALAAYGQALALFGDTSLKIARCHCLTETARAAFATGNAQKALALLDRSRADNLAVLALSPTPAFKLTLVETLTLYAEQSKKTWDIDGAIAHRQTAHELIKEIAMEMGRVIDYKRLVASYRELISLHRMNGNFTEAHLLNAALTALLNKNPNLQ